MANSKVKGLSISDIMGMDIDQFNRLSRSELAAVTSRLASAANKRLRRFEEAGRESAAYNYAQQTGGKFSTKGKNINALRAEFSRVRGFLESKTSSLTGLRRVERETMNTLRERGINVNREQIGNLFSMYDKLKEMDPAIAERAMKYRVLSELSTMPGSMDAEEKILAMREQLGELYEEQEENNGEFLAGTSGYFGRF